MTVKRTHLERLRTYFCSFICLNWLPLFEITGLYDEIYKWFNLLVKNKNQICGFVIMPNHLHLIIHIIEGKQTINTILGNGKRFLAYEIVKRLEKANQNDILKILANHVTDEELKRKKKHRVFEISSDIKPCDTEAFLLQKLNYIHANPVSGKWQLADSFEKHPHSSAGFYELNVPHSNIHLTHYKDVGILSSSSRQRS